MQLGLSIFHLFFQEIPCAILLLLSFLLKLAIHLPIVRWVLRLMWFVLVSGDVTPDESIP